MRYIRCIIIIIIIFFGGVAQENGVSCVMITCTFSSVLYSTRQFELDEKDTKLFQEFGRRFTPKTKIYHAARWGKQAEIGKSVILPMINARALTCYFLTRSLNSWRHVLFNYPYLKYYLNKNLGVFGSDWQSGLLNYKYPPHMNSSKVHMKWNSFKLSFRS